MLGNYLDFMLELQDMEARALSLHLCMVVTKGVKLASRIMVTACINIFFSERQFAYKECYTNCFILREFQDSAALRLDKQGEIYLHTTKQVTHYYFITCGQLSNCTIDCGPVTCRNISHFKCMQTLNMYVPIFVKLAEDANHQIFNNKSVFSLLGALRGVAAISHILVKDALESVEHVELIWLVELQFISPGHR